MEDNSAVVTMANNDSGYTKKCKPFLMVLNYIKEQMALGQIEARKIYGKLNNPGMHTSILGLRTHGKQDPRTTCRHTVRAYHLPYTTSGKYVHE
jgi:hypothetical protein